MELAPTSAQEWAYGANSLFHAAAHVCPTIPLVAAQSGLSPGADVDQYRRSPSPVPAQM